MTTTTTESAVPKTIAASLFVAAFNTVYEDDPRMTIALHTGSGSRLAVSGELDDHHMRFQPVEVSTLLAWITRAVAADPDAVITVLADYDADGEHSHGWAWSIRTGAALDSKGAAPFFPAGVELRGAEQRHVVIGGHLVNTSARGLSATALTEDVKTVVTAHGQPPQPAQHAATVARTYARSAYAAFDAARARLADLAANRPLDLDAHHHNAFIATRALYAIYHRALLLDDDGNSAYDDDRVIDRLKDTRTTNDRRLRQSKTLLSGLNQVEAHHHHEATRRFLSDTDFLDES